MLQEVALRFLNLGIINTAIGKFINKLSELNPVLTGQAA